MIDIFQLGNIIVGTWVIATLVYFITVVVIMSWELYDRVDEWADDATLYGKVKTYAYYVKSHTDWRTVLLLWPKFTFVAGIIVATIVVYVVGLLTILQNTF